jgi:hypothetical protein
MHQLYVFNHILNMNSEDDILFMERVTAKLRGELSADEQSELNAIIESDPARKLESEQFAAAYHLLALCAAAESPPKELSSTGLKRLQEAATKVGKKPKKPLWYYVGIVGGIIGAMIVICLTTWHPRETTPEPYVEYAMRRQTGTFLGFLGVSTASTQFEMNAALRGNSFNYLENDVSLNDWENNWSSSTNRPVFKVLLLAKGDWEHLAAKFRTTQLGEVRVTGHWKGNQYRKTILINSVGEWEEAIQSARRYIETCLKEGKN